MPQKQEKLITNPNSHIKPGENIATPMTKDQAKIMKNFSRQVRNPSNPQNWLELKKKMEVTGTLSIEDFRDIPDMMNFLDFYNSNKETERKKILDHLIHEITDEVVKYKVPVPKKYIDQEIQKKLPDLQEPIITI